MFGKHGRNTNEHLKWIHSHLQSIQTENTCSSCQSILKRLKSIFLNRVCCGVREAKARQDRLLERRRQEALAREDAWMQMTAVDVYGRFMYTPWNIAPARRPSQKETRFQTMIFKWRRGCHPFDMVSFHLYFLYGMTCTKMGVANDFKYNALFQCTCFSASLRGFCFGKHFRFGSFSPSNRLWTRARTAVFSKC